MKNTLIVISLLFLISCDSHRGDTQQSRSPDRLIPVVQEIIQTRPAGTPKKPHAFRDTTINFSIEGISAEGSEAVVHYIFDTISTAEWNIFGETGQWMIKYKFLKNGTVRAFEKNYTYKKSLTTVKSDKDMILKNSLQYVLDTNGVLLTKVNPKDFVNVFSDFKNHVPMVFSKGIIPKK